LGALIIGIILAAIGIFIQILEIVRIYTGLYDEGGQNADFNDNLQFPTVNIATGYILFVERWHFWPWTYAG
jgi:hypothetical protein